MLSDYKFGDEAAGEIQERFVEMLDQAVQAEDIHVAEEMSTGKYGIWEPKTVTDGTEHFHPHVNMLQVGFLHIEL